MKQQDPASMINKNTIAVVGGGLSGRLAAIAAARAGWQVTLFAPQNETKDRRSTALLSGSLRFLEKYGLLQRLEGKGADLRVMRLMDGTYRLLRTPVTEFDASEAGLEAFGTNFLNVDLLEALEAESRNEHGLNEVHDAVETAQFNEANVVITTSDGSSHSFDFVIAADGRNSVIRQSADIETRNWTYPQIAFVGDFSHSRSHGGVSNEFHTHDGPFTTVPMPGRNSSLVWVVAPEKAEAIAALSSEEAGLKVEQKMQSMLGSIEFDRPLQSFPLSGMLAKRFAAKRCVLVGEAAHVFPPIGAQGFNLGVRDVQDAINALGIARPISEDDAADIVRTFNRTRRADVTLRTGAVDVLNRSLLTDILPVQFARGVSLHALSRSRNLRKVAMSVGLGTGQSGSGRSSLFNNPLAKAMTKLKEKTVR
jgi:2-octaprenyl-6-methoxyphenol hydroxylase